MQTVLAVLLAHLSVNPSVQLDTCMQYTARPHGIAHGGASKDRHHHYDTLVRVIRAEFCTLSLAAWRDPHLCQEGHASGEDQLRNQRTRCLLGFEVVFDC